MTNLQTPNVQTGTAGADLTDHAFKIVAFDSNKRIVPCVTPSSATAFGGPIGVCYGNVGSLQAVGYAIGGHADVFCANTLAPGDFITCNSVSLAYPAAPASGDTVVVIGQVHHWAHPGGMARVELIPPFRLTGPAVV